MKWNQRRHSTDDDDKRLTFSVEWLDVWSFDLKNLPVNVISVTTRWSYRPLTWPV